VLNGFTEYPTVTGWLLGLFRETCNLTRPDDSLPLELTALNPAIGTETLTGSVFQAILFDLLFSEIRFAGSREIKYVC
jgi:hypothetical protein